MPGATVALGAGGVVGEGDGGTCMVVGAEGAPRFGDVTIVGDDDGAGGVAGGEFKGAPTAMSQRCPGSP